MKRKRYTINDVREAFEKEGYQLLTKEYVNSKQKLDYICPKGHRHSVRRTSWQQGHRCPYCDGQGKPTIEFIRSEFAKEGYILLTDKYINTKSKLDYICPKGHKHSICWANWQQGQRCYYCKHNVPTIEFIKKQFEKENYKLLTVEYKNCYQKLDYICLNGHKHSICWNDWKNGNRCPYCAGQGKPTIEFIKSEFAKEGYRLLTTEYKNAHRKLSYICSKWHKHNTSWNNWQRGKRCPYCAGNISKGEIEVRNFIKSLGIEVSSNDRSQIFNPETGYGFELDIFMPYLNKAVEYNGEYWHQDKTRDLLKQQLCESKNIDLLTIWDRGWETNSEKCKKKIIEFIF